MVEERWDSDATCFALPGERAGWCSRSTPSYMYGPAIPTFAHTPMQGCRMMRSENPICGKMHEAGIVSFCVAMLAACPPYYDMTEGMLQRL